MTREVAPGMENRTEGLPWNEGPAVEGRCWFPASADAAPAASSPGWKTSSDPKDLRRASSPNAGTIENLTVDIRVGIEASKWDEEEKGGVVGDNEG